MAKKQKPSSPVIAVGEGPPVRVKMPMKPDSPEQRLHDIVSTVGDWIWETNEILEMTFVSDRFSKTTGLPPDTLIGKTLQQVVLSDESLSADSNVVFTLDHREPFHDLACSFQSADGSVQHFTVSGIPYYSETHMFRGYRGAAHNITGQLKTQAKYHRARKKLERPQIAEVAPSEALRHAADKVGPDEAFVIYGKDGHIIAASEGYAALYPAIGDMILPGATLREILTEAANSLDIKESKGRTEDWVEEKLAERLNPDLGQQEIFRGGRWWRIHEQRTQDGTVISLHTDITRIRAMEASMLDAETRYRRLVELAPDLTCVVTDGIITLINSAGARTLKAGGPQDLIGKRIETFVHPDFHGALFEEMEHLTEETWLTVRMIGVDGTLIDAEIAASPFSERGLKTVMLVARDMSERKRAAEALITRDAHIQGIMDVVADGIISIDAKGVVQSYNQAAERIFGYSAATVIGKPINMLMPKRYADAHDGYLERYLDTGEAHVIGFGREVEGQRKDGSTFPLELTVTELKRNGEKVFIGVVRDITERKRAEEVIRDSEERYALAIRGAGEGIWDWDIRKDEVYISLKLREMSGLKERYIKPADWAQLIHPDDRIAYHEKLNAHLKGETPNFYTECRFVATGREERWIRISGMVVRDRSGWAYRMAGSVGDITSRVAFEQQLRQERDRAEIASRVKTEFLANMSHELRTPLNAIIGFSDIMLSGLFGKVQGRYHEYITNVRDSGRHLLGIINDILDVSRVEAGRMDIHPERVEIDTLIESSLRLIRDRAHEAGVRLRQRTAKDLPALMVDDQRVKQILLNILSNAVKFTPEDGTVTIAARKLKSGMLVISVKDTGIGMSKRDMETALTPFGQVDSKLTRKYEGTGLGLPLTQSLIELHGGTLTIKSRVGEGTTVSVHFPPERQVG